MKKRRIQYKLLAFVLMIVSVFAVIAGNVFVVTIRGVHLRSGSDISLYSSSANTMTKLAQANRGHIFDKNGNIIAQDTETYTVYAVLDSTRPNTGKRPAYVQDKQTTAEVLSTILNIDEGTVLEYLNKDNYQVEFGPKGRNLSLATKEKIESYDLPGIEFAKTWSRTYPLGVFASHLIGFAQYDEKAMALVGKMGIEKIYNEKLTGTNGYTKYQVDKDGYMLPGTQVTKVESINGHDVYLTLDRSIQENLELSLQKTMSMPSATKAFGAVMEVHSGKILAYSSYPSFDPNTLNIEDYTNVGLQFAYEPGSTMKAFTYAAAIDTGVYNSSETFNSSSFYMGVRNGNPIRLPTSKGAIEVISNARKKSWGNISYDLGFVYSSNVAIASLLSEKLDPRVFEEYLDRFGFFKEVEVDGFSEVKGVKNYRYPIEKIAMGYGQGSSVTMMQMLQAFSAIFSDGTMVKPYFVQQIKNANTNEVEYLASTTVVGKPIAPETAKKMQELMYQVVNRQDGSGRFYRVKEVEIIGKTGTAQVFIDGSYKNSKVLTSIMLAFPAEDPEIMVYYAYISDYNEYLHVRTDPITELVKTVAINYGLTTPSEERSSSQVEYREFETYTMPNLINHSLDYASDKLYSMDVETVLLGNGTQVIDQYPVMGSTVVSGQRILLRTSGDQIFMPNVIGYSRKEIAALWNLTEIAVTMEGYGSVTSQSIAHGELLYPDSELIVEFK